jgi:hypothetical protein
MVQLLLEKQPFFLPSQEEAIGAIPDVLLESLPLWGKQQAQEILLVKKVDFPALHAGSPQVGF